VRRCNGPEGEARGDRPAENREKHCPSHKKKKRQLKEKKGVGTVRENGCEKGDARKGKNIRDEEHMIRRRT